MNASKIWLKFILKSDAAIGRGNGVAGLVNAEIKHDSMGLPYISGKTLKGLLVAQCAEILSSLEKAQPNVTEKWKNAARMLFGEPGSRQNETGKLRVESACLPPDLRAALAEEYRPFETIRNSQERERKWGLQRTACLEAVTALRRQTAISARTGAPLRNSLRTIRVVLRTTPFIAPLEAHPKLENTEQALLAVCVSTFRRLGSHRNRGLGEIKVDLFDLPIYDPETNLPTAARPITQDWIEKFEQEMQ